MTNCGALMPSTWTAAAPRLFIKLTAPKTHVAIKPFQLPSLLRSERYVGKSTLAFMPRRARFFSPNIAVMADDTAATLTWTIHQRSDDPAAIWNGDQICAAHRFE